MNNRHLLLALALLAAFWFGWDHLRPNFSPSHTVQYQPDGAYRLGQYSITPLEPFQLQARVLGREIYRYDRGADVSPVDLALGWGPMADPQVLSRIDISQGNRWYRWRTAEFPISRRDIEVHSANMHMIPANAEVAAELARIKPGEQVALSGQLVRVDGDDGFQWISSLTRDDTGEGACELVWVEKLERLN
ncbi:MAG: hypothetical protein AAAB13_16345 [Pseudomonas sp.]